MIKNSFPILAGLTGGVKTKRAKRAGITYNRRAEGAAFPWKGEYP
jgi:hypothetical protein